MRGELARHVPAKRACVHAALSSTSAPSRQVCTSPCWGAAAESHHGVAPRLRLNESVSVGALHSLCRYAEGKHLPSVGSPVADVAVRLEDQWVGRWVASLSNLAIVHAPPSASSLPD